MKIILVVMKTKGQTVRQIDIVSNTHTHSGTYGKVRQNYLGLKQNNTGCAGVRVSRLQKDFYGRLFVLDKSSLTIY